MFPMIPPLTSTNYHDIGIQDICLKGKEAKFWVRFYYPSKSKVMSNYDLLNHFFKACILDIILMAITIHFGYDKKAEMNYIYFFWFWHFLFEIGEHIVFGVSKTKYLPDHVSHKGIARYSKLPEILFSHMQLFLICGIEDGEIIVPSNTLSSLPLIQPTSTSTVPTSTNDSTTTTTNDSTISTKTNSVKIAIVLHGLSGYRSTYTSTCLELASLGYLVISPEFGDSTPASSLLPDGFVRYYEQFQGSLKSVEYQQFRQKQLIQRVSEINTIMSYLQDITLNNDPNLDVILEQKYSPHVRWNTSKSLFIQSIRNISIDFQNPLIIGHSFGGATGIYLVSNQSNPSCEYFRKTYGIGGLILYDPWMFPLSNSLRIGGQETIHYYSNTDDKNQKQSKVKNTIPILCFHAEKFQWKENLEFENEVVRYNYENHENHEKSENRDKNDKNDERLRKQKRELNNNKNNNNININNNNKNDNKNKNDHSFIYQIHLSDAGHMNYTDASTIAPYLMSQMKSIGKQDPVQLLNDINAITVQFIQLIEQNNSNKISRNLRKNRLNKEVKNKNYNLDDDESKEISTQTLHETFLSQINKKKTFNVLYSTYPPNS